MRTAGLLLRTPEGFQLGDGVPLTRAALCHQRDDDRIFGFGTQTLRKHVKQLGDRAGIAHVHPHLFHHSFASHFRLEGGDEASLMALGGWSSVEMARYYGRSVLGVLALQRSRDLDLTERLIQDATSTASSADIVDRVLGDPQLCEQVLTRLAHSPGVSLPPVAQRA